MTLLSSLAATKALGEPRRHTAGGLDGWHPEPSIFCFQCDAEAMPNFASCTVYSWIDAYFDFLVPSAFCELL
jgi:hypothetical protein